MVVSLCGGNGFSGGGFFKGRSEVGWSMVGWWWLVCRSFPVSSLPILHSRGHWVAWQCVFFWRQFSSPDVGLSYPVDGWSVTRLDPMGMMACTFSPREMSKSTFVDWGVTSSRLVNPPFISMLGVRVLVSRAGCWHSPVVSPQDWRGRATLKWQNVSLDISDRSIGSPPTWQLYQFSLPCEWWNWDLAQEFTHISPVACCSRWVLAVLESRVSMTRTALFGIDAILAALPVEGIVELLTTRWMLGFIYDWNGEIKCHLPVSHTQQPLQYISSNHRNVLLERKGITSYRIKKNNRWAVLESMWYRY